ncbi:MAG: WD40/YVTN/BNR-like repeat-containing protein [Betaproteobacteria bacterium]
MTASRSRSIRFAAAAAVAAALTATPAAQRRPGPRGPQGLAFRFLGPAVGNRVASIAGVPGDPYTYYAGAASGGVWKTTDGGIRWTPVSDSMPVTAIGALAVAPTDHATVWAGTGEPWAIRDSDVIGDGVYRSSDAGKTWTHMGLDETGRIARIIVHPKDPDVVFVCAEGRLTGPQQERGVFRTTDGGAHWERVLFVDEKTGCSGLSMDPRNPRTLFAGTWQVEMHPWAELSGGPGSGVYVSHDGGTKWTRLEGHGLPHSPLGKIDVAVAPTDSSRVYALIQTADQGSVWRSDDGGQNWRVVNWSRELIGRAGYYIRIAVSPANEDEVLVSDSSFFQSTDGGYTFYSRPWGGDNHDIWWDPENADRFAITHDGGLSITTQHGRSIQRVSLPIGQMYHVAVDNQVPYWIYSNMQDDGTMRGPSNAPEGRAAGAFYGAPVGIWEHNLGGCESGFTMPDPADPNIVWASCYGNKVTRYDARIKEARSIAPSIITLDAPPPDVKYRTHWTAPLAIDPFDHNTVYYGAQVIFATTNGGQSWKVISPDLSTQDPSKIMSSGGIVGDNLGQFAGEVVFAIAPSDVQKGLIWAGTNDGKLWYTKDGGGKWNDVTKNMPGMPAWGVVSKIEPSHFDAGTAYVAVDAHLMDSREPFIFKTTDFGATWTRINSDLPNKSPLSYVKAVAEDPNDKNVLFAGTGNGFYYSLDGGGHWTELSTGLPHAPVSWVVVQKQFHDVVISTYGRGLYILDDITPLEQQGTARTTDAAVRLYVPRPAYRWSHRPAAYITYSVKDAPKGPVHLQIVDAAGKVVRNLPPVPAQAGLNRVTWDLRYDPPTLVALRTTPAVNPYIWEEPRFRGQDTRPVTHWGLNQAEVGPMVAPGKFTVKLTADGRTESQPIEVLRDPKIATTDADLEASVKLQLRIRDDIDAASSMINNLEIMRKQLEDMQQGLKGDRSKAELLKAVDDMEKKMFGVETQLLEPAQMTSDDKYFQQAYRVYMNLIWLNGEVGPGAGDVAGGTDFRPTDTSVGVLGDIEKALDAAKADYSGLLEKDLANFNRVLAGAGLVPISKP